MTQGFVPFRATVEFTSPGAGVRGVLVLQKDNPSDRRELNDELRIPIVFK